MKTSASKQLMLIALLVLSSSVFAKPHDHDQDQDPVKRQVQGQDQGQDQGQGQGQGGDQAQVMSQAQLAGMGLDPALAQALSAAPQEMVACFTQCAIPLIVDLKCPTGIDPKCVCTNNDFVMGSAKCVREQCKDQVAAGTALFTKLCGNVPDAVKIPGAGAANETNSGDDTLHTSSTGNSIAAGSGTGTNATILSTASSPLPGAAKPASGAGTSGSSSGAARHDVPAVQVVLAFAACGLGVALLL